MAWVGNRKMDTDIFFKGLLLTSACCSQSFFCPCCCAGVFCSVARARVLFDGILVILYANFCIRREKGNTITKNIVSSRIVLSLCESCVKTCFEHIFAIEFCSFWINDSFYDIFFLLFVTSERVCLIITMSYLHKYVLKN